MTLIEARGIQVPPNPNFDGTTPYRTLRRLVAREEENVETTRYDPTKPKRGILEEEHPSARSRLSASPVASGIPFPETRPSFGKPRTVASRYPGKIARPKLTEIGVRAAACTRLQG